MGKEGALLEVWLGKVVEFTGLGQEVPSRWFHVGLREGGAVAVYIGQLDGTQRRCALLWYSTSSRRNSMQSNNSRSSGVRLGKIQEVRRLE